MSADYEALLPGSAIERDDFKTAAWAHIRSLLQDRLAALREENDDRLDEVKTATVRGRIAEVKALLALEQHASAPASSGSGNASVYDAFPGP